jgi:hypothetical protein
MPTESAESAGRLLQSLMTTLRPVSLLPMSESLLQRMPTLYLESSSIVIQVNMLSRLQTVDPLKGAVVCWAIKCISSRNQYSACTSLWLYNSKAFQQQDVCGSKFKQLMSVVLSDYKNLLQLPGFIDNKLFAQPQGHFSSCHRVKTMFQWWGNCRRF